MIDSEIESFLTSILLERGLAKNTCDAYRSDLMFFAAFLKSRKINSAAEIAREDIVEFLRLSREEGLRASTRARRTAAIRSFLKDLRARRLIRFNPADLLDPPHKDFILPKTLSEEEVFKMLDDIKGTEPRELRDRAMLEVLYGCGLRVSELCHLRMDDIIGEGELVRVFGKGSKERVVPIGSAAGRALTDYFASARNFFTRGNLSETHVFVTRFGHEFTRQGVFKIIKARAAAVDIALNRISPHVMRHCFASHMLAHGADIRAIQEMLGHADVGTTQIYTHVDTARFGDIHHRFHPRA